MSSDISNASGSLEYSVHIPLLSVGETREGYKIYRKENGVGGHIYMTDELGAIVWDTVVCTVELMKQLIQIEEQRIADESK